MPVEGAHGDDTAVGGRVVRRVAFRAVVARRGDEHDVLRERVADGRLLGGAAARAGRAGRGDRVERQVDDAGVVPDGPPDTAGNGVRQPGGNGLVGHLRVVAFQRYPHREDLGSRRDADNPTGLAGAVPVAGDKTGHFRAVNPPELAAGRAPRVAVVRTGGDRAGEVRLRRVHAGVEHGDGNAGSARGLPGIRDVKGTQPPFIPAGLVGQRRGTGRGYKCQAEKRGQDGARANVEGNGNASPRAPGETMQHGRPPPGVHVRILSCS